MLCYDGDCLTDVDAVQRIADVRRFPHVEEFRVELETTYAAAEANVDSCHISDERQITVSAKKHCCPSSPSTLCNMTFRTLHEIFFIWPPPDNGVCFATAL